MPLFPIIFVILQSIFESLLRRDSHFCSTISDTKHPLITFHPYTIPREAFKGMPFNPFCILKDLFQRTHRCISLFKRYSSFRPHCFSRGNRFTAPIFAQQILILLNKIDQNPYGKVLFVRLLAAICQLFCNFAPRWISLKRESQIRLTIRDSFSFK